MIILVYYQRVTCLTSLSDWSVWYSICDTSISAEFPKLVHNIWVAKRWCCFYLGNRVTVLHIRRFKYRQLSDTVNVHGKSMAHSLWHQPNGRTTETYQ